MTLKKFVLLLIVVPTFALLVVGGLKAGNDLSDLKAARNTVHETGAALTVTNLVHYLQIERGKSVGFILNGSEDFEANMRVVRGMVDKSFAATHPSAQKVFESQLNLPQIRSEIDDRSISASDIKSRYSAATMALLDEAASELLHQKNPVLVNIASGLVALNLAKEAASRQRAAGVAVFGENGGNLKNYHDFVAFGAAEFEQLHRAQAVLGEFLPDLNLEHHAQETGFKAIVDQVDKAGPNVDRSYMTSLEWFEAATHWIEYLRMVEDAMAAVLLEKANSAQKAAVRGLMLDSLLILFAALTCVVIGSRLLKTFNIQIGALQKDLNRLAQKDFDFSPTYVEAQTEVGQLSRAMDETRKALQEAESILEAQERDRKLVIEKLAGSMQMMADRDLTCEIRSAFPKEYETLRTSFNTTVRTLGHALEQVVHAAGSIHSSAAEVSQAADDLSHRTESQAATLEQTAAALEELSVSVASSAEGARSVEGIMDDARQEAQNSGKVVQNAVGAMNEIEQSSNQIAKIISVIDEITFQTNLLALNAGVEAARAGEAGRGFAVVASEVRALALRSADAATEIKELISESSRQVREGVDLVGRAGGALNTIVEQVNHISQLVSDIATGSSEQSTGLNEINIGVTQLDQVTQQNAAMVEETTAAGHLLASDASGLADLVQSFKLPHRDAHQPDAPRAAQAA